MQVRGFQKTSVRTLGGSVRIWGCLLGALGILGREIGIWGGVNSQMGSPSPLPSRLSWRPYVSNLCPQGRSSFKTEIEGEKKITTEGKKVQKSFLGDLMGVCEGFRG